MVIDPSVLVQIIFDEPGAREALRALHRVGRKIIPAPGVLAAEIIVASHQGFGSGVVRELLLRLECDVVPFTNAHLLEAKSAFERFSKRQGHPAHLNFGDCMIYAVARASGEVLAFKGDHFDHTGLRVLRTG